MSEELEERRNRLEQLKADLWIRQFELHHAREKYPNELEDIRKKLEDVEDQLRELEEEW